EDTQVEDLVHFIYSFATAMASAIHVKVIYGENQHHKIEAAFKGLGFVLKQATRLRKEGQPETSSKGVL
ncbi:MAG: bifunctional histidinol-phosphatase/imidazoleglycerol-phosphate dehydratase, partial [Candidatus Thorarchaeota archaeon]